MANSNPAFSLNPAFNGKANFSSAVVTPSAEQLDEHFGMPTATAADMGRMSYEDTIVKTVVCFAVLLGGAAIGWFAPVLALPAGLVAFVLALVNIFKRNPSAPLVLAYAAFEGVLVGAVSQLYQSFSDGVVPIAVFGTLAVVGVTLALFCSGKVRASKRATKVFLVAMVGYLVFSLVNVVLMMTGVTSSMYGINGAQIGIPGTGMTFPLGLPLGILAVLLGAYSLVLDFDSVQQGVRAGAPRRYGWSAAFGIMVTVVWLYFEILRVVAIVSGGRR